MQVAWNRAIFEFFRYHLAHVVALYKPHIKILEIAKTVVAVMCLIRDIDDRHLPCLALQVVHAEIYAVVIAIGTAHCHYSPKVACIETIKRGKELYYIALKFCR